VEDNAGAFVTPDTMAQSIAKGMKLSEYMDRNDAYGSSKHWTPCLSQAPRTPTSTTSARCSFCNAWACYSGWLAKAQGEQLINALPALQDAKKGENPLCIFQNESSSSFLTLRFALT